MQLTKKINTNFYGSLVALVTPMDNQGKIDFEDLTNLIDFHITNQTDGLVILGTTGEAATVSLLEREAIIRHVITQAQGRLPIIVGTGLNCTQSTIELTQHAQSLGADGALVVTPYYNKPTQKGLLAHYRAISDNIDIPILLYNVPSRTACDMQPETVAELATYPNIIGLKEAVSDLNRIKQLVDLCPKEFVLLSGDDETLLPFLEAGGHGVISVTANIAPKQLAEICRLARNNHWQQSYTLNAPISSLHKLLFVCANPIPVKWALYYLELIKTPECRLPLLALEHKYHDILVTGLQESGILTGILKKQKQIN